MKIQSLAIIFIIIIMPISIVLSEYINNKITTEQTELVYHTRLLNSTYDAIKAYQLNTVNNAFGDVTNKKIEDIEAAANTFYNSLTSSFNYTGYRSEVMKEYVPAIAFTMYDGYYIYSPFYNTLTEVPSDGYDKNYSGEGSIQEGLKPYVYYSCRYVRGSDDFIITYTLDNYITIQGNVNGKYVYDYGYIYSLGTGPNDKGIYKKNDHTYCFDGVEFSDTDTEEMKEYVGGTEYSYAKINGKKYYLDEDYYSDRGSGYLDKNTEAGNSVHFKKSAGIFFIDSNGTKNYSQTKGYIEGGNARDNNEFLQYYLAIKKNKSAFEYYKNAYEFSKAVLDHPVTGYKDKANTEIGTGGYGLSNLKASHAYIWANPASDATSIQEYGDINIFAQTSNKIQNDGSNFNQHRKAIIRYVVETNLATSISAFSSNANAKFVMPKISEEDWETIQNDVCAISFLQGMSIGAKKYNGYAVVANTLTKEYIDESDIYILTKDNNNTKVYCKLNDKEILAGGNNTVENKDGANGLGYYPGIWKLNFEQKQGIKTNADGSEDTIYYHPIKYLGSYTSIMGSYSMNPLGTSDVYDYIHNINNANVKKAYLVALGRERWGSYNVNNINYEIYGNTNGNVYFIKDY